MKIKLLDVNCMPYKKHKSDAGYDLKSTESKVLYYKEEYLFDTGIQVEIPYGCCGLVFPRSGLGNKGATLKNTVGVIDADYRGNIFVKIKNTNETPLHIGKYDRFAQLVIVPIYLEELEVVDELSDTHRGEDGFGSSGT